MPPKRSKRLAHPGPGTGAGSRGGRGGKGGKGKVGKGGRGGGTKGPGKIISAAQFHTGSQSVLSHTDIPENVVQCIDDSPQLKTIFDYFLNRIAVLEAQLGQTDQYSRRSTIVVAGLPIRNSADGKELKKAGY